MLLFSPFFRPSVCEFYSYVLSSIQTFISSIFRLQLVCIEWSKNAHTGNTGRGKIYTPTLKVPPNIYLFIINNNFWDRIGQDFSHSEIS